MNIPDTYELIRESRLKEVSIDAALLRHKKSGARVVLLPCEDENKLFCIGFRTPPADNTGVPHILEHSVLCGSEKFPLKDPFMELNRSSLNTFLNAMTYPDKTVYPVASCNDKDFANLMDVYLDAVFHPLLHRNESIFRQEGWRIEIGEDGEFDLNGVVYSEMKGAFSSPDEVLERYAQNSLYPDTPYRFESGGDPEAIPTLSYEEFCAFHRRYYHPSNSYIFFYGNMDMEERLRFLDEAYLNAFTAAETDSEIPLQAPFEKRRVCRFTYPVGEEEAEDGDRTLYSLGWSAGNILDARTSTALNILETVLLELPGAPLKQALLDEGLARDAGGYYANYTLQPQWVVSLKDAPAGAEARFVQCVEDMLKKIADEGLDPAMLQAVISSEEFSSREADYGGMTKGLIYSFAILNCLLYDEKDDPFRYLRYEEDYAWLRKAAEEGYFESLIRRYLLDNSHSSLVVLEPDPGKASRDETALREKLKAYRDSLSPEELGALAAKNEALRIWQEKEETQEEKRCIPQLSRTDLRREVRRQNNCFLQADGLPLIAHPMKTAGIAYAGLYFDARNLRQEDLPWLGLYKSCFAVLSTKEHSYTKLAGLIMEAAGGFSLQLESFDPVDTHEFQPAASLTVKALYEKWPQAISLVREVVRDTLFTEDKRLKEIISELAVDLREKISERGHVAASSRAATYYDSRAYFADLTGGLSFYRFITELEDHFEERKEEIRAGLQHVYAKLFTRDSLLLNLCCEEAQITFMQSLLEAFVRELPSDPKRRLTLPEAKVRREGIMTNGSVGYVALAGSFLDAGPYTGALRVLRSILSNDYLWQQLRVFGGAYGAMCQFARGGGSYFVSYRDPNLDKTLAVYRRIPEAVRNLAYTREELDGFIISTVGGMDMPLTPAMASTLDFACVRNHLSEELLQKERDEILKCTLETLRGLAPYMEAVIRTDLYCAFSPALQVEEQADLFDETEAL